jgi:2-(1,2-epoxy-1,2-dihydrophenyl)acetyl-CoA isomerase
VLDRALAIGRSMANASPLALGISKRALNASQTSDLQTMLTIEADGQGIAMSSEYHATALARFLAKEPPLFNWPQHSTTTR